MNHDNASTGHIQPEKPPRGLISRFSQHPLAANLLMIIVVLAGLWGLRQLTIQLNPGTRSHSVSIDIAWPGAAAEDVERLLAQPIEYQLRSLTNLVSISSSSEDSAVNITVKFEQDMDMGLAIDHVKQQLAQTRDLPTDMEEPVVRLDEYYETVAALMLTGSGSLEQLVTLAHEIKRELLAKGADQVDFIGLPEQEITIQIDSQTLFELGVPLHQIALNILDNSTDLPAGNIGDGQFERSLRALEQRRSVTDFAALPVTVGNRTQLLRLADIAQIERRQQDQQRLLQYGDKPAITLVLRRSPGSDIMAEADILRQWQTSNEQRLQEQGVKTTIWLEAWRFAREVLMLVISNGISGMALVITTLFIFLRTRVAGWVTLGIPVSFLGAMAIFHFAGGSINFVSLVGAVMALGIVVDDAIVVGEHALSRFEAGASPQQAASQGARHMLLPVMASSLTTMAAFLPLMMLNDDVIREIPVLMICIIIASLLECFLILPGHLRHAFESINQRKTQGKPVHNRFRQAFDRRFSHFRDQRFKPLLEGALANRRSVIALSLGLFVIALSLLASGRIKPEMNLSLNFEFADAHIQFTANASENDKQSALAALEQALMATHEALGGQLIVTHVQQRNWARFEQQSKYGSQYAAIWVELVPPNEREISLQDFVSAWQQRIKAIPVIERLRFDTGENALPDLQLYFSGGDVIALKTAAQELATRLQDIPGVLNSFDDLPYGKAQWLVNLTTEGRAAGLSSREISRQIRFAYEGYRLQAFTEGDTEVEVRVSLPVSERLDLGSLQQLPITTPAAEVLPLSSVATISARRGIDSIDHRDGLRAVNIYASIDNRQTTAMTVISELEQHIIPAICERYGVSYGLGEGSAEEARILDDMLLGAATALLLIYIILAWIFTSWSWPLAVMLAIPLGLTGALFGLQLLQMNLGVMAIMGLFTLTGVIINDSIILINAYKANRTRGLHAHEALVNACCERLRPVILTSVTTTIGLIPLILEHSPSAEIISPLAVVICFGLLYGTTLILFTIPAVLSLLESLSQRRDARKKRTAYTSHTFSGFSS
ncbi:MAG: efflux RND transporter permease subunit [Parahaliea sp.]